MINETECYPAEDYPEPPDFPPAYRAYDGEAQADLERFDEQFPDGYGGIPMEERMREEVAERLALYVRSVIQGEPDLRFPGEYFSNKFRDPEAPIKTPVIIVQLGGSFPEEARDMPRQAFGTALPARDANPYEAKTYKFRLRLLTPEAIPDDATVAWMEAHGLDDNSDVCPASGEDAEWVFYAMERVR